MPNFWYLPIQKLSQLFKRTLKKNKIKGGTQALVIQAVPLNGFLTLYILYIHYLSIYISIYLFIYLLIYISIYLSIYLSIYIYIYLFIYLLIYISIYISIYLSIYLSIYISTQRGLCALFAGLPALPVLYIYLSIHLSVYI